MPSRAQKYRLKWPWTPSQVTNLDEMLQEIFDDAKLTSSHSDSLIIGTTVEAFDADLDALAALTGTGIVVRTGSATYSLRTIIAGTNISIGNGNGVAGNPSVSITGVIAIVNGGTNGTATPTAGAVTYGTGTAYAFTAAGTSGQILVSAGAGTPTWQDASAAAAHTILSATHTDTLAATVVRGDLIAGNSTPKWARLAIGATNRVLRSNGTDPSWAQVDLTTDVSGDLPFSSLVQASAANRLVGRGSAAGAGDFQEITLGSGLTMTGTVLDVGTAGIDTGEVHQIALFGI